MSVCRPHSLTPSRTIRCALWVAGCVAVLVWGAEGIAQNAQVSGFVTDGANGQALERVNVVLEDVDRTTLLGGTTNRDGLYVLSGFEPGRWVLTASFIGYHAYVDTVFFVSGQSVSMNIALELDEQALGEVVVEADREEGLARVIAGQQTIRPADIERIPSPDLSGDLANYLAALPGVVSMGDRGGQLFIRGGEPSHNLVRLDGMTLYQPFHLLGFYSAFPADIISRSDVYLGGFGSPFGERISSVVDVWTRIGNKRTIAGAATVSPFVSSLRIEGPILRDRISVLAAGRLSTVRRSDQLLTGRELPFSFGDFFAKVHADVTQSSRLSISALGTFDRGSVKEATPDQPAEEVEWKNQAVGFRYLLLPSMLPVVTDFRISYSRLASRIGNLVDPDRESIVQNFDAVIEATNFAGKVSSRVGMEVRVITIDNNLGGAYQGIRKEDAVIGPFALYAEPEYDLGWLTIRPGIRMQLRHATSEPQFEPRVRLVARRKRHLWSAAVGRYSQEVIGINDRRDAASVFTAWANVPRTSLPSCVGFGPLGVECREARRQDVRVGHTLKSLHAIAGYQVQPFSGLDVAVEGYYKHMSDMLIAEWTPFPRFTNELQPASGRSRGFDVRMEGRLKALRATLSYAYSDTEYDAEQESIAFWYGVEEVRFRPAHDLRHQLNALLSSRILGFDVDMRWSFGSGLPFTRAVAFDGFAPVTDIVNMSRVSGWRRVIYGPPYEAELPPYHRLDISVERSFKLKRAELTVQGSVINLYNRRNIFYIDAFTYERVDQLPFLPTLGLKLEV